MKKTVFSRSMSWILSVVMLLSVTLVLAQPIGNIVANAAGNSPTNATKININQTYTDKISTSSEKDYFKFTLDNDSKISIDFSHDYIDNTNAFWRLYLYNSNDTEIYEYFRIPGDKRKISTCNIGLPKGDYYIKIVCGDLYNSMNYSLMVNATTTDNWEKEFNSGYGNGTKMAVNKDYYGSLMSSSDKDFYNFTLQSNSKISIDFGHDYIDNTNALWRLYLYNSNDTEIYEYFRIPGNKRKISTCNIGLPKGDYYIKIVCGDLYTGIDYSLKVNVIAKENWEKEFNNSYGSGTKIAVNKDYYGSLMSSSDKDFYKFTLQNDSKININFSHNSLDTSTACWRLYLYDMSDTEIYNYFRIPGNTSGITTNNINLEKGSYYIKIVCGDAYTGIDYFLKVVAPNAIVNPTSVSLNKTSLSLNKGDTYTINATVSPSNATNKTVIWTTSNSNVATVSGGKITAKGVGTATITAKTSNGKTASCKVTVYNPLTNNSKISATSVTLGTALKVTCSSTGGTGTKQYAVWYKQSTVSTWTKARDYATGTTITFTPKHTGKYDVSVKVKDAKGTIKQKSFTVTVNDVLKNTSSLSATAITKGKSVTVKASSTGGLGTKQYAVWYKQSTVSTWTKARDYATGTTVTFTPKHTGTYKVSVNVKDSKGTIVNKAFTLKVNA